MNFSRSAVIAALGAWALSVSVAEAKYIKAVTYFGNAWPINYWNSNVDLASTDFKMLKKDGFNAVILVVPWGEFQPGVNPPSYNENAYARLGQVCQTAKENGLEVYMRVSYLWDMYPDEQLPSVERATSLMGSDTLMPAWKQYLKRIGDTTKECASGSFISWEDFLHTIQLPAQAKSETEMAELSRRLGFDAWVRKNADRKFLEKHSQFEKRMGVYPVPGRKDPDFQLVFQWFDDQLMHRLVPALAETLPGASLEARVDDDPIYDGDKLISWYSHKLTYKIASSPFVMTYWAPAMGARNRGEVESAKKVVHRFSSMQKKISDNTTNKIFIEQFLFKDNTPSAAMNSAIAPREVSGFIRNMAGPLVQQTSGYALWGAQDYDGSTLFNGFFTLGAQGWKFLGGASVVNSDNGHFAQLPKDSTIVQTVPFARDHFRPFAKSTTLRFRATGPGVVAATYAGATHTVKIKAGSQLVKLTFPVSSGDSDLSITSKSSEIKLTDVYLFTFTQISDVRNSLGKPRQHLPDIQALNKAIDAGVGLPSHLNANDKSLARANGVYSLEQSGGNWYAWTGPEVSAKLLAKSSSITVRGYIKPSMYDSANGCVLNAFVDNSKAASEVYKLDSPILLTVPVSPTQIGTPIDFRLSSTCAINPKNAGQSNDDRTLSFILNEIRAQ